MTDSHAPTYRLSAMQQQSMTKLACQHNDRLNERWGAAMSNGLKVFLASWF